MIRDRFDWGAQAAGLQRSAACRTQSISRQAAANNRLAAYAPRKNHRAQALPIYET
jgi:hypothetical protein